MEIIYPQHAELKKYVRFIYRVCVEDHDYSRNLIVFPNIGAALVINKDVKFSASGYQLFESVEETGTDSVLIQLNRIDPICITERGCQKRVGMVFHPLGINQFMTASPGTLLKTFNPTLVPADDIFPEFTRLSTTRLFESPLSDSASLIEEILLKRFRTLSNGILENALRELSTPGETTKINEISSRVGASPKILDRLFFAHIGLLPSQYRKICQFRKALVDKLSSPEKTITDVAWDQNYYDLSYMMKAFQQYTGMKISKFFQNVAFTEGRDYIFIES